MSRVTATTKLKGSEVEITDELRAKFFRRVRKDDATGCWLWTGSGSSGGKTKYGQLQISRKITPIRVHRFSWRLHYGEIPDGKFVCHKCDVPLCVNPDHLFLGDDTLNTADMARKNRGAKSNLGFLFGVTKTGAGRFRAACTVKNERIYLGTFDTEREAEIAATAGKMAIHEALFRRLIYPLPSAETREFVIGLLAATAETIGEIEMMSADKLARRKANIEKVERCREELRTIWKETA